MTRFEWPKVPNVSFEYMDEAFLSGLKEACEIKRIWETTHLIRFYSKKHNVSSVFLISLISYVFFLPFLLPKGVKVSGIIYNIYLYSWNSLSYSKRIRHILLHLFLTRINIFEKIFVLNDSSAACYFNRLYHSNKYYYTPDPIVEISAELVQNDCSYAFPTDKVLFLQCGLQTRRKKPLDLLKAINSYHMISNSIFVFAGKISEEIRDEFYSLYENNHNKDSIYLIDKHLSYNEMAALMKSCDFLFVLYDNNSQSSGFIGHAASNGIPVIARKDGLIGKLVRKYKLGLLIDDTNSERLCEIIEQAKGTKMIVPERYRLSHTVELFTNHLFD